jgi:uncharacterized protein (UPF0332 family)
MTLQPEERNVLVEIRLQRAKETLAEVKGNVELSYWRVVANRLYYACYYAVTALLIKNGLVAHTHTGVINQLGLHFVIKGIISMEQGKLYRNLFEKRQSGDYDDWVIIEEQDIKPFIVPAERFIAEIEGLINKNQL